MTRAEVRNGKWHIIKRHYETKNVVAVSELSFKTRPLASAYYMRMRNRTKFNLV